MNYQHGIFATDHSHRIMNLFQYVRAFEQNGLFQNSRSIWRVFVQHSVKFVQSIQFSDDVSYGLRRLRLVNNTTHAARRKTLRLS
jgi:hypothetical protein